MLTNREPKCSTWPQRYPHCVTASLAPGGVEGAGHRGERCPARGPVGAQGFSPHGRGSSSCPPPSSSPFILNPGRPPPSCLYPSQDLRVTHCSYMKPRVGAQGRAAVSSRRPADEERRRLEGRWAWTRLACPLPAGARGRALCRWCPPAAPAQVAFLVNSRAAPRDQRSLVQA